MSAAAHSEAPAPVQVRPLRWAQPAAIVCGLLILAATLEIVLDAAVGRSPLTPKTPDTSSWMDGIGTRLGFRTFLIALLLATLAYAGLAVIARREGGRAVSQRFVFALLAALHILLFIGPILLSTDVFSYIAYARMGAVHGINPYVYGPIAIHGDPIYTYVGHDWREAATAYGPLYTLASYPLALLGVHGALWGMKTEALLASIGVLWLTWRCARLKGFDPVYSLLLVGANPLYLIFGLGGAHNDLLMMLAMMGAVALALGAELGSRREAVSAGVIVAGALTKATVGVMLPFMVIARRRWSAVAGAAAVAIVALAVAYAVFGRHGVDLLAALNRDAALVSSDSFANELGHLFGKPGVFPIDHDLLKGALVVVTLYLLWRTWRGYDWIAASGWALLAISVTSTWLLAWYILWPLPLAVISRDRRLLWATLTVQALFILHQMTPLIAPVQ